MLCVLGACTGPLQEALPAPGLRIVTAPPPSETEEYCAWFGARHGDLLYFGQAAFWSAMRAAGGDPRADLAQPGPQLVGRFDLATETLLAPLDVTAAGARSGVWDVHVTPDALWFTTFYELAGRVDRADGGVRRLREAGGGLNEWAPGPAGSLLVSRYGSGDGPSGSGAVLALDAAGQPLERLELPTPGGVEIAPKTVAWQPGREWIWATTDAFSPGGGLGHPTYRHEAQRGWRRIDSPELQFVAYTDDGRGYHAEVENGQLWLRIVERGQTLARPLLDPAFPTAFDFVQDIQTGPDGRTLVTRWSGRIHVLDDRGEVSALQLPRLAEGGLYYTAVARGSRLCATYCKEVTVVCTDLE